MTVESRSAPAGLDVSRETLAALEAFAALVKRWNPAINLVSKATLPDIWNRHIIDSAQLFELCPPGAKLWLDIGSGGGFPGIFIAALARELRPELKVMLVESDLRKATFLRESCRTLGLDVDIQSKRIESLPSAGADVLSARALAPLTALLAFADRHLVRSGVALFPKGSQYESEVAEARKTWSFDLKLVQSQSDSKSAILEIRNARRA
jgi:16S rRNA (guanine527-N7)-methyltransferase